MRLFFALGFSPATRQAIAQVQQRLRQAASTARCPAEGNLHLTLAFLGEVPPVRLEDATAALEALSPRRLALRLSQIGQFPQEGGLWWLGAEPCPELFALREELIFQLEQRGLWYQPGEFRPHVTLARKVSFPGEAPGVEALLPQPLAAPCGRVSLVRSQLTAAGALYNEVAGKNPPV